MESRLPVRTWAHLDPLPRPPCPRASPSWATTNDEHVARVNAVAACLCPACLGSPADIVPLADGPARFPSRVAVTLVTRGTSGVGEG